VLGFLVRLLITTLAVLLASVLLPPDLFHVGDIQAALLFAFVLGLLNAIVRPVLAVITLPLTILTVGLFLLVLNALMFWLASAIVPGIQVGGLLGGFFGAFLASLIVTFVSAIASHFIQ
jgi:putative membrane protein